MFYTTSQESLRIQKDRKLGIMDKDWSTAFRFVPPCRSRNFKTMATLRLRKDPDNYCCVRFLEIEDI